MKTLMVVLHDRVVGTLSRPSGDRLQLEYDESYRTTPEATPLSLSMPLTVARHPHRIVNAWLQGLLPDNERVIARWARHFKVGASAFSLLGTPVGLDCPGAVRFVPEEGLNDLLTRRGSVRWMTRSQVAERLRRLKKDSTSWLGEDFTGQFSLGGAQAKTALFYRDGRWGEPRGTLATTHILKPAVAGLDDHDLNEHLCLEAAGLSGLVVARTRVEHFEEESAIVIERYDRKVRHGAILRIHQEDACQALGIPPSKKYQTGGGPGAKEIAALLRSALPAAAAEAAVGRFLDALIWNWLIGGTDAHAKNYSLLLEDGQRQLAPLYDVASALAYRFDERELRLAMRLGNDYKLTTRRDPWPTVARELGLGASFVVDRARQLATTAPEAFSTVTDSPEVRGLRRPIVTRLTDRIAVRCRWALASLAA